ncbi:hypothetical protein PTTG_00432 [Puccinia triticina 1-1 BBBD Race 1]|uniref:Uncharacterized protein n=1 Tax=Puccinia triticina (isolate 1-1 / race 1 (BBBD)) TaxID=630390 RepID=A0A180H2P1_PUCT1|nr:hypothetical protein PTTG_00432 [Puccinia triticina 1-1 BBBD Race 1]WAR57487.1 hypothetical protein PtB15_8B537 [Puccinia triticina]
MAATNSINDTITTFSQDDRLDKLPPLGEQYAIDDLLTEHFGFAPKVFTGHIFNIINEAIYDTVVEVEKAVIESYFPGTAEGQSNGTQPPPASSTGYPSKDDIAKSLNQLETLLCSSIDNQFDLLEIWLHRNVFNFPSMREEMMKHFRFKHMNLWDQFYNQPQSPPADGHPASTAQAITPDWEKLKNEEEERWSKLEKFKSNYNQSKDDYHSLLAVSSVLDRKLAGLKSVSSQLNQISSETTTIYDPETNKPVDLSSQSSTLLERYQELLKLDRTRHELQQAVNFEPPVDHSNNPMTGDESSEEQDVNLPTNQMAKHSRAINQLVKAKTDDFLAELADKGSFEVEKDEGLVEVLNVVSGKGKTPAPDTPLHQDRL